MASIHLCGLDRDSPHPNSLRPQSGWRRSKIVAAQADYTPRLQIAGTAPRRSPKVASLRGRKLLPRGLQALAATLAVGV